MSGTTHRTKSGVGAIIAAFLVIWIGSYFLVEFVTAWPPPSIERRAQRQKVAESIHASGGWDVLRRDALLLMEQHGESFYAWSEHSSNALPASIAALKPMAVKYYPSKFLSEMKDGSFTKPPDVRLVHIRMFGMPSTGGHPTPYFGLEIVSGPDSSGYRPRSGSGVRGNRHTTYTNVAEGIYEVY